MRINNEQLQELIDIYCRKDGYDDFLDALLDLRDERRPNEIIGASDPVNARPEPVEG